MSGQIGADPAILGWIVQEVGHSLDEATDALMRFVADPADSAALATARKALMQVRGALELAGLRGIPRLIHEIHALVQDVDGVPPGLTAGTAALCTRAFAMLRGYLSELQRGEAQQPLKLASVHQEVIAARGVQRLAELDLFYPDSSPLPPEPDVAATPEAASAAAREQRSRYQQGMLAWLRGDSSGLARMREAIGRVDASQPGALSRRPWWIAAGFLDLLAAPTTPQTTDSRRVCAALDQLLRRSAEGNTSSPDELLREMLYFLSIGQPVTERIVQIKRLYLLDAAPALPGGLDIINVQVLEELRGKARLLKSLWEKAVTGAETGDPAPFAALIGELSRESLPFAPLGRLTGGLRDMAESLRASPPPAESAVAIEIATALLLLENTLAAWPEADPQLEQRVAAVEARIAAAQRGQIDAAAAGVNLQADALREGEARTIRAEIAGQMLASLNAAQTALETTFGGTGAQELTAARKALAQVHGALVVLEQEQAALLAQRCGDAVGALQDGRSASAAEQRELACVLSALYVFVERLGVGSAEFEEIMRRAQVPEHWYGGADAGSTAPAASPAPEMSNAPAEAPAEDALVDSASDPELLAIFLEEAEEVLAAIATNLAHLRQRLDNAPALATIRRAFHTLKGSGRMVGLTHVGESAWTVERLLNDWLQSNRPPSAELVDFLQASHLLQAGCIDELKRTGRAHVRTEAQTQWADRIKRGDAALGEPSAPAQPPEAAAGASPESPVARPDSHTVQIGPVRLSPALYATYLAESAQRLASVRTLFDELAAAPERGVTPDLTRHIHSLAGISGTAGFHDVRALAGALERVLELLPRDEIATHLDPIGRALAAMAEMVAAVHAMRLPEAMPELAGELELIAALLEEQRPAARVHDAPADPLPTTAAGDAPAAPAPEAERPAGEPVVERRRNRFDDDIDQQLLPVFLEEAAELVPQVGRDLRDWRADPSNRLIPESLKRLLHTLKGSARMVGAMAIGELTHAMETRVVNIGALSSVPDSLFEELEASFDRITLLVEELENGAAAQPAAPAAEPVADGTLNGRTMYGRTMHAQTLVATVHGHTMIATLHGRTMIAAAPAELAANETAAAAKPAAEARAPRALLRVRAELVDRLVNEAGEVAIAQSRILAEMRGMRGALKDLTDNIIRLRGQARELEIQAESQMQSRMLQAQQVDERFDPLEFDRFTRLQELTRFVAESVNDVATVQQHLVKNLDEADAALLAQRRVARGLQDGLMGVRLVPFSSLSDRLYRVARLTAREAGKRVNLDLKGGQVELDRSVLERIAAPLEHLLRNAIVHGVETPEARRAAGKPETGEVVVEVRQEGNEVLVTFRDDGSGLDHARIREKALRMGLLREDEHVPESQLGQFIFAAGFSTAAQLSQAAGRGVGLDVVKSEITDLGGRVEVDSTAGHGATFRVYLPLTLAVMQALLVRSGDQLYALPALMIENVQKMRDDALEQLYATGELIWQDRRYPLCHLQNLLADPDHAPRLRRYNAVVLMRSGPQRVAVHVDEFVGSQEIVVKNIGAQLTRVTGIAGAAVIGNGDSVLIINPVVLADRLSAHRRPQPARETEATLHGKTTIERAPPTVMVVDDSLTVRRITGRLLTREGYVVIEARDGVEALEKLQHALPDVMLLDIEMPRMDGFELTRRMRGDGRFRRVPIIMITSRTADKHRTLALELGVNVYLGKPYQEEVLLGHIAGFLAAAVDGAQP